jgi:putative FmdB family regulatory protein
MPIYVYVCDTCGLRFERRQSMLAQPLVDCPECEGHVQRVVQPVGVVFRGSGFYVTDRRKSGEVVPSESASKVTKDLGAASSKREEGKA